MLASSCSMLAGVLEVEDVRDVEVASAAPVVSSNCLEASTTVLSYRRCCCREPAAVHLDNGCAARVWHCALVVGES